MPQGRCRILLVEDDPAVRVPLAEGLTAAGVEVRSAWNGRDALAVLRTWRPALIVLDLRLPDMDGWEFRDAQRRMSAIADIPIVVLSAADDLRRQVEGLDAAEALPKSCDLYVLLETIGRLTERGSR